MLSKEVIAKEKRKWLAMLWGAIAISFFFATTSKGIPVKLPAAACVAMATIPGLYGISAAARYRSKLSRISKEELDEGASQEPINCIAKIIPGYFGLMLTAFLSCPTVPYRLIAFGLFLYPAIAIVLPSGLSIFERLVRDHTG